MIEIIYCIDASSLMELNHFRPIEKFPDLWKKFAGLVNNGRIIAPEQVFKEVKYDDELVKWVKKHKKMFKELDGEQVKIVQDILSRFSSLVDSSKETMDADPFVIALAVSKNKSSQEELFPRHCIIVTEEKPTYGRGKMKIPDVSSHFGIECIYILNLFVREKWEF